MRANSAKTRNSAIGLIALVAIGCVQNRQARIEKTPIASEQGGWIKKFPYLTSNTGRQSVFDDPSQWPARPPEAVVQTRFAQLFPNLSRRSSGRDALSATNLAQTPDAVNASLDSFSASEAPAEPKADEPSTVPPPQAVVEAEVRSSPVSTVAAEPVKAMEKVDWATLSANSAGVASVVAALASVSDAEVVSAAEVRAETERPESASQGEAVAAKPANLSPGASPSSESVKQVDNLKNVATPPAAAEPVVQTPRESAVEPIPVEGVTSSTANAVAASSPNPEPPVQALKPESAPKPETPRSTLTAVQANEIPAALPSAAEVAIDSKSASVSEPQPNPVPGAEPVAKSEGSAVKALEIPGILPPSDQTEHVTERAKDIPAPAAEPVQEVAIRETAPKAPVMAPPAESQPVVEAPVAADSTATHAAAPVESPKPMPEIPAIPVEEVAPSVAVKSPGETGREANSDASPVPAGGLSVPEPAAATAPEVPAIPVSPSPEPVVPGLPVSEPNLKTDKPSDSASAIEATAPAALPVRDEAEAKTLEIPGVPAAPSSVVTERSNEALKSPSESRIDANTQRPESAPAPAELTGTLSEPPPPAPAPELQVPGISETPMPSADPASKPAEAPSPSDAGVERSSGAAVQAASPPVIETSVEPASTSADAEKASENGTAAAEGAAPGEAIPVLQPLPDDESTQRSEASGSAIERKPGELVIHLRLSNPFRLSRFTATPDDQPSKVSTARGLKSAARNLFAWQRGPKADSSEPQIDSNLSAAIPAPEAAPEPAAEVAEKTEDTQESGDGVLPAAQPAVAERVANEVDPAIATQSHIETTTAEANAKPEDSVEAKVAPEEPVAGRASRIAAYFVPGRTQADTKPAPARTSTRTSNGLPAVEFPASYHAARPRSANPWYAHAKPAVNPLADPRRDMAPVTSMAPATSVPAMPVTKTESKPMLKPDLEVVRTSMNVPAVSNPGSPVKKGESTKDQPVEKVSSSWWSNGGKGLRRMIFGEEEVVPAKRPNWATRQTSGL